MVISYCVVFIFFGKKQQTSLFYSGYTIILWDNGIQMKNEASIIERILQKLIDLNLEKTAILRVRQEVEWVKNFEESKNIAFHTYKYVGGTDLIKAWKIALEKASSYSPSRIILITKGHNMLNQKQEGFSLENPLSLPIFVIYFNEKKEINIQGKVSYLHYSEIQ